MSRSLQLEHRYYSGKLHRPQVLVHESRDLIILLTAWGNTDFSQSIITDLSKYIESALSDVEVTSPYERLSGVSTETNYLRIGLLITNESIYRSFNREYISCGFEISIIYHRDNQLSWARVGGPDILLKRKNSPLQYLLKNSDLNLVIGKEGEHQGPLPENLLGVELNCRIDCGELIFNQGDQLLLISRSGNCESSELFTNNNQSNLSHYTKNLSDTEPNTPFWIGLCYKSA